MNHDLPITQRILSPTDLSQFLRLERCERFLPLRVARQMNLAEALPAITS